MKKKKNETTDAFDQEQPVEFTYQHNIIGIQTLLDGLISFLNQDENFKLVLDNEDDCKFEYVWRKVHRYYIDELCCFQLMIICCCTVVPDSFSSRVKSPYLNHAVKCKIHNSPYL